MSRPAAEAIGDVKRTVREYEAAERRRRWYRRMHPFADGVSDEDVVFAGMLGCAALASLGLATALYGLARVVVRVVHA